MVPLAIGLLGGGCGAGLSAGSNSPQAGGAVDAGVRVLAAPTELGLGLECQQLALAPPLMLPSVKSRASASSLQLFGDPYPAHLYPCLRFAVHLATHTAKLAAEPDAPPLFVRLLDSRLLVGLSRRTNSRY